jgi:hypothetical protein
VICGKSRRFSEITVGMGNYNASLDALEEATLNILGSHREFNVSFS